MQLSRAVDYGLLGLTHLARTSDKAASVNEIANAQKLSLAFLRKIFQKLEDAKLVIGKRGTGYTLAHAPESISLKDVIEAVEGPTALQSCLGTTGCTKKRCCRLTKTWADIQKRFLADLHRTRLTDLI